MSWLDRENGLLVRLIWCGVLVGEIFGETEGHQRQERRGQQPSLEGQQLSILVVIDNGRGGGLVEAGFLGGGLDLVAGDEIDPGSCCDADL